jgi:mRNA interferase MazF
MIEQGELYLVDLGDGQIGSQQKGKRPCLIVSCNKGNKFSNTVIVATLTTKRIGRETPMPTHTALDAGEGGIARDSVVSTEQLFTIDKEQLRWKIGKLSSEKMNDVFEKLSVSLGLKSVDK